MARRIPEAAAITEIATRQKQRENAADVWYEAEKKELRETTLEKEV